MSDSTQTSNQTREPVTYSVLKAQWEECVRLVDGAAVDAKLPQQRGYYYAQGRAMSSAFEALPDLMAIAEAAQVYVRTGEPVDRHALRLALDRMGFK